MQKVTLLIPTNTIVAIRTFNRYLRCRPSGVRVFTSFKKDRSVHPNSIDGPLNPYLLPNKTNNNNNQHLNQVRFASNRSKIIRIKLTKKIMSYYNDYEEDYYEPVISHGESVVDRKSVFQGHCAAVSREDHTTIFLNKLKENKKIENAFHNMWAYRIDKSDPNTHVAGKSATILQDCDDDGEQAAGGRLLNLLQILNVTNVMVVVTRWYGGIQLGPARFKHINNAARDALVKGGFVGGSGGSGEADGSGPSQDKSKSSKGGKSKNKKSK